MMAGMPSDLTGARYSLNCRKAPRICGIQSWMGAAVQIVQDCTLVGNEGTCSTV